MSSVLTEDDTVPDDPTLMVPDHYEYPTLTLDTLSYGSFYRQIGIHQGQYMHQENYRGQNMLIVILDGGYEHLDTMAFWQSWRDNQCVFTQNVPVSDYKLDVAKKVADRVFKRRNKVFDEVESQILDSVYQLTEEYRRNY